MCVTVCLCVCLCVCVCQMKFLIEWLDRVDLSYLNESRQSQSLSGEKVYPCYHLSLLKGPCNAQSLSTLFRTRPVSMSNMKWMRNVWREVSFQHTSYVFVVVQTNWVTFNNERKAGWCCLWGNELADTEGQCVIHDVAGYWLITARKRERWREEREREGGGGGEREREREVAFLRWEQWVHFVYLNKLEIIVTKSIGHIHTHTHTRTHKLLSLPRVVKSIALSVVDSRIAFFVAAVIQFPPLLASLIDLGFNVDIGTLWPQRVIRSLSLHVQPAYCTVGLATDSISYPPASCVYVLSSVWCLFLFVLQ